MASSNHSPSARTQQLKQKVYQENRLNKVISASGNRLTLKQAAAVINRNAQLNKYKGKTNV